MAQVPMLLEGTLPDFNFGNNDGAACGPKLLSSLDEVIAGTGYSHVVNGRFKRSYITRSFGLSE